MSRRESWIRDKSMIQERLFKSRKKEFRSKKGWNYKKKNN